MDDLLAPDWTARVQLEKTGLVMAEDLSLQDWMQLGQMLVTMHRTVQWWIGDWLRFGELHYGEEEFVQIAEAIAYDEKTLANWMSVAAGFPHSLRRERLTWSHHAMVAGLKREQQERLLNWAEQPLEEGRAKPHSTYELREERKRLFPTPDTVKQTEVEDPAALVDEALGGAVEEFDPQTADVLLDIKGPANRLGMKVNSALFRMFHDVVRVIVYKVGK